MSSSFYPMSMVLLSWRTNYGKFMKIPSMAFPRYYNYQVYLFTTLKLPVDIRINILMVLAILLIYLILYCRVKAYIVSARSTQGKIIVMISQTLMSDNLYSSFFETSHSYIGTSVIQTILEATSNTTMNIWVY